MVAGSISNPADYGRRDPFIDVFTMDAGGAPGSVQVIDASGLVSGYKGLAYWPEGMATDGSAVVIGDGGNTVGNAAEAGSVQVFSPDPAAPAQLVHRSTITQASPGVTGTPEARDDFGSTVALRDGYLAIGAPCETLGRARCVGQVQLMRWDAGTATFTPLRALDQNTPGVPGTNESYDEFGRHLAVGRGLTGVGSHDVVVGVASEDVGEAAGAGAVTLAGFTTARYLRYTQNSKGVPGTAEKRNERANGTGEAFGYGIGLLPTSPTTDTIAIGAPDETNGSCLTQGYLILSDGKKLSSSTKWTYLKPPTDGCSFYDADVFNGWGAGFGN